MAEICKKGYNTRGRGKNATSSNTARDTFILLFKVSWQGIDRYFLHFLRYMVKQPIFRTQVSNIVIFLVRRVPFICCQILPDSTINSCSWITGHVVGIADSDWLNRDKTEKNIVFHFFWPIFAYLCTPSVAYTWSVCPLVCMHSVCIIKIPINMMQSSIRTEIKTKSMHFFELVISFHCRSWRRQEHCI